MHLLSWPPQSMMASTLGLRCLAPATCAETSLTWKSKGMKRLVSSTIWLPVTTVQVICSRERPSGARNSSAILRRAPMLQRPQALHFPVHAMVPVSTGRVRW